MILGAVPLIPWRRGSGRLPLATRIKERFGKTGPRGARYTARMTNRRNEVWSSYSVHSMNEINSEASCASSSLMSISPPCSPRAVPLSTNFRTIRPAARAAVKRRHTTNPRKIQAGGGVQAVQAGDAVAAGQPTSTRRILIQEGQLSRIGVPFWCKMRRREDPLVK